MTPEECLRITPEDWRRLPFGEVRIEHGFPGQGNQSLTVCVDGKPVARLAVTRIAFEQSYADGLGKVTLTMTAGDCLILASRPKLPGHDDPPGPDHPQQDSAVPLGLARRGDALGRTDPASPPRKPPLDPDHVSVR